MRGASVAGTMDYLRLSDQIETAGQPTEAQLGALGAAGIEIVINLRPAVDTLSRERAILADQGIEYVHIPVSWEAPTTENVCEFFDALDAAGERRLFVHCARNMRVSAFICLYRVVRQGVPADQAEIDLHRVWRPDGPWRTLIETMERDYRRD